MWLWMKRRKGLLAVNTRAFEGSLTPARSRSGRLPQPRPTLLQCDVESPSLWKNLPPINFLKIFLFHHRPLLKLQDCMKSIESFLLKLGDTKWMDKFMHKKKIQANFDNYNDQLTTLQGSLGVCLQVGLFNTLLAFLVSLPISMVASLPHMHICTKRHTGIEKSKKLPFCSLHYISSMITV